MKNTGHKLKQIILTFTLISFTSSCSIVATGNGFQILPSGSDPTSASSTNDVKYSFPLKVTVEGECDLGKRTTFEITKDGTFSYNKFPDLLVTTNKEETVSRQLTSEEIKSFKSLIEELDLAKLSEKDEKLSVSLLPSDECRVVENFILNYKGTDKTFGKNERTIKHSEEYLKALDKLKIRLEQLRDKSEQKDSFAYSLPLKVSLDMECNLGNKLLYEISDKGLMTYSVSTEDLLSTDENKTETKQLTDEQLKDLKSLLDEVNISALASKDTPVSSSSGLTADCRGIENYTINVNSSSKTFDYNGRKINHTDAYLDALDRIKSKLESFGKTEIVNPNKSLYSLPLLLKLEGECGLGNKTNFDIDINGVFKFYNTDNTNDSSMIIKQLSKDDISGLNNLLNEIDLDFLSKSDEKVAPGTAQTKECRTVEKYIMNVNSSNKIFDKNSRDLKHSQDYLNGIEKLKSKLEEFRKKYSG